VYKVICKEENKVYAMKRVKTFIERKDNALNENRILAYRAPNIIFIGAL
jgi:hypothetical protein